MLQEVHVGVVAQVAVGDVEVFPAVVVEVGEQGRPTPIGVGKPGELPYFLKLPVAVVDLQHIAHILVVETQPHVQVELLVVVGGHQEFLAAVALGQHIQRQDVGPGVVVDVGYVAAHREVRGVADLAGELVFESALFIVDVEVIRYLIIVGDVNICPAIAVDVRHARAETVGKGRTLDARRTGHVLEIVIVVAI